MVRRHLNTSRLHTLPRILVLAAMGFYLVSSVAYGNDVELDVDILYIEQRIEHPPVLSNLVSWPDDEGE